jgi:hypothetical protein
MVKGVFNRVLLTIVLVVAVNVLSTASSSFGGFISLKKAFEQDLISLEMIGLGCYNDACLEINIENKTDKTLLLEIDAGTLLEPFDPLYQPFLIKDKQKMALPAGIAKRIKLAVYCANINKAPPAENEMFAFADSTPTLWYQVVNYLAMNDFEKELAQKAVWSVTSKFPMNAVCSANKQETAKIRLYLQSILPFEDQGVNLFFKNDSMGIPTKELEFMRLELPYSLRNNTMVSFYITDSHGQMVKKLKQGIPRNPGSYTYEVEFSVVGWRPGDYFIIMRSPEQLLLKKPFKLEVY